MTNKPFKIKINNPEDLPPCLIHIDKEGKMYHLGAEMIHPGINSALLEHIRPASGEKYIISWQGQECLLDVEDTPLVITRTSYNEKEKCLDILISDGTTEHLNPELLWINEENVIYTKIRKASLPTRFLRQAYYQLAEFIEEAHSEYGLSLNGKFYPLKKGRP